MSRKIALFAAILLICGGIACADPPPPGQADPISLDKPSPSVANFGCWPSHIYGEAFGPMGMGFDVGGPGPIIHVRAPLYGLGMMDENDAHSLADNNPNARPIVYFSATRRSRGAWNTQYRHQANRNQAAGDRFVTNGWMNLSPAQSYMMNMPASLVLWQPGFGPNLLSANQTRYNEIPSIMPAQVNPTMDPLKIDDMDALDLLPMDLNGDEMHDMPIYFSLAPGSPSLPPTRSPADIFVSWPGSGAFNLWAPAASMGLWPNDNIDALVVYFVSGVGQMPQPGVDYALFSLAPGNSFGASPSDVYVTSFQGYSTLYFHGSQIGLIGKDNLDGLDVETGVEQGALPQIWDELPTVVAPPMTPIGPGRRVPDNTLVNLHGIVTLIGPDYIYIEEPTRASGVRIQTIPPWYVSLGDDLQAVGIIGMYDGERAVFPSEPVSEISSDNPIPAPFDLRTRAVGGGDLDISNPGVSNGRGALNVGLKVRVMGMVTAVDPSPVPRWFYIWDGANSDTQPLNDGSGNLGVRVEQTALTTPWIPWKDWVEVFGVVSTDAAVVPGRVIPLILPTAPPGKVTSFDAIQAHLRSSWNLTALPVAPAGTSDGIEHSAKPWDPPVVFAGGDPTQLDGRMYRWESCSQSLYTYDMWSDDHVSNGAWGPFGGALLGDGYWVDSFFDVTFTYSGKKSMEDKWVSVCKPGWIILGHPKEQMMPWEDVRVHDGAQIKTLRDASQYGANWLSSVGYWWDAATQSLIDIGIPDDWPSSLDLDKGHGYWFQFYEGNKALLFPADATARFEQVDWNLDGFLTPNSEWGSLDLTFSGSEDVQYLNLSVNGSWQAQNVPLLSVGGTSGPKTLNVMFDLGTPRGMPVGNISYGYTITKQPQYAVPLSAGGALVGDREFELYSGTEPESIAGPPEPASANKGEKATKSAAHSKPFPNQECGKNECVPAAVSNSLQFLNSQHSLGMDAGAIDIGDMKSATGWTAPGCGWTWYNNKAAWMAEKKLPIKTTAKTAAAGINMDDVVNDIQNGNDVELVAKSPKGGGHCVAVTGCTKNADGTYSVTISHDTDQTDNSKGTTTETVTYDPATGKFTGGSLNGWSLHHVVTESPKK